MEKTSPIVLIQIIDDSKIPLGEEEAELTSIRGKVKRGASLSRGEEVFLARLVDRANEWQRGMKSSQDTDPTDTLSG